MSGPRGFLRILRPRFSRGLAEIEPKSVLFTEVHLGNPLGNIWRGVELGPFLDRVGIEEWISNLGDTVCAISDVKGCIALLEMLRQRLSVGGWLGPL